jgi:hypothetical protein
LQNLLFFIIYEELKGQTEIMPQRPNKPTC